MKSRISLLVPAFCFLLFFTAEKAPDEGMWLPDSVDKLPLARLRQHWFELSPEAIYRTNGPSLVDAVVLLGGGTASFVSPKGLLLTNHHVAYSAIQSLSSVKNDYLKDGFLAEKLADELPTTYTAQIVLQIKDVTQEVRSAASDTMTRMELAAAIRKKSRELERAGEGPSDTVRRVYPMYEGNQYSLVTYLRLKDIRLVYAPPSAIGNFGGEVDNWMWPRHTGDFSIMRAYVGKDGNPASYSKENVPYTPAQFLPISTKGYHEGSFAMILGFPGRTFRYREAAAIEIARDVTMPATIDLYGARIGVLQRAGERDRDIQIKYASRLRSLANTYKNYMGTLEGMRRSDLLDKKRTEERELDAYIRSTPSLAVRDDSLLTDLNRQDEEQRNFLPRGILFRSLWSGTDLLRLAGRIRTSLAHIPKDSLDRPIPSKERTGIADFASTLFRNYVEGVDKEILKALMLKSAELPPGGQPRLFREIAGDGDSARKADAVNEFVDDLYRETALSSKEKCTELLQQSAEKISDDAGMKFAEQLAVENASLHADSLRINAELEELRGRYINVLLAWKHDTLSYPDANRSLRLTYGEVEGYSPRDAVCYRYCTTLTGVMEKRQSEEPFIVPQKLWDLWARKDFGRYADTTLHDVPVAFISNLDITGGNSGSPVINGNGELIGCAFDGNWESVVGDYLFEERYDRTISVDARYILFILDKFSGAQNILNELLIH